MTATGLKNRELKSREGIERRKILHEKQEGAKNRASNEYQTELKAAVQERGDKLKAGATLGSSAIKGFSGLLAANDPEWYKSYIRDLGEFVQVPTYDRLGTERFGDTYSSNPTFNSAVPGIMIFHWVPTIGPQDNGNAYFRNAINQTLSRMKEKVLAMNSRSNVNWEGSDLGYNIGCSADIMGEITELGRVIKAYQTYHAKNAYFAKTLVKALGWDYSDIEANFAEYRKTYTMLARKFNSAIVAPASISLYKRRLYLAGNVFGDHLDGKEVRQMYAFVEDFPLTLADTAEFCNCLSIVSDRSSIVNFRNHVQLMMSRITDDASFIEMYQDLRHAFGDDLVQLPETVQDEELVINTGELNREQIHNLCVAPIVAGASGSPITPTISNVNGFDLCQDADGYLYQGTSSGSYLDRKLEYGAVNSTIASTLVAELDKFYGNSAKCIFNMHKADVSGDDIIDITRLRFTGSSSLDASNLLSILISYCGTEVVYKSLIWVIGTDSNGPGQDTQVQHSTHWVLTSGMVATSFPVILMSTAFDWAPITAVDGYTVAGYLRGTVMDAFTTFIIDGKSLGDIHNACVMGELYCADSNFKSKF